MERDSELDDLADRFIRLWEDSWQQLAEDPEVARHWSALFEALGATGAPDVANPRATAAEADESAPAGTDRPATAAAAPVDGSERVDRLTERVRKLEERVARLARRVERRTNR